MYISVHAMHVAFIQVLAFKYFTTDSHFFKYLEFMMFLNSLCACLCVRLYAGTSGHSVFSCYVCH